MKWNIQKAIVAPVVDESIDSSMAILWVVNQLGEKIIIEFLGGTNTRVEKIKLRVRLINNYYTFGLMMAITPSQRTRSGAASFNSSDYRARDLSDSCRLLFVSGCDPIRSGNSSFWNPSIRSFHW